MKRSYLCGLLIALAVSHVQASPTFSQFLTYTKPQITTDQMVCPKALNIHLTDLLARLNQGLRTLDTSLNAINYSIQPHHCGHQVTLLTTHGTLLITTNAQKEVLSLEVMHDYLNTTAIQWLPVSLPHMNSAQYQAAIDDAFNEANKRNDLISLQIMQALTDSHNTLNQSLLGHKLLKAAKAAKAAANQTLFSGDTSAFDEQNLHYQLENNGRFFYGKVSQINHPD
ncbi:hypothetical protein PT286_00170 [Neisseriaceae bacterium ESL0693]|nr:hypothetical protein [Neisseriaceae bacterium ESL0693]